MIAPEKPETVEQVGGPVRSSEQQADQTRPPDEYPETVPGWILVNPRILLGLVGCVFCVSWLFIMLGTSSYLPLENELSGTSLFVHLGFMCGLLLSLFLAWLSSDFLSAHRVFHFCSVASFTFFGSVGILVPGLSLVWYAVFTFLTGIGFGLVYILYAEYLTLYFKADTKAYVLGIFLAAAVLSGGVLIMPPAVHPVFAVGLPLASLLVYAIQMRLFRLDRQPVIKARVSDGRTVVPSRAYLSTFAAELALGYALGCLLSSQDIHSWGYIVLAVGLVLFLAWLLVDSLRKNRFNESLSKRWFLPASAVIVFPMLFVPDEVQVILAVVLLCGSLFPTTLSISAMCKHVIYCRLSPVRAFSYGRLVAVAGLLAGTLLGVFGFSDMSRGFFGESVTVFSLIVFMVCIIFFASFAMIKDEYPEQGRFKEVKTVNEDGEETTIMTTSEAPLYPGEDSSVQWGEKERRDKAGLFFRKCMIVAEQYELSERQKEVFLMLAKGRNADYVTKKLVISAHTAKAHIYNIYQKTGVHSRQELMDLVEEVDIESES